MAYRPVPGNVLREVVEDRHWRTPRVFQRQFQRAARELGDRESDPDLRTLDVSERQFERWLTGVRPRPDACRVLEYMFGLPVGQLLGGGAGTVAGMGAAPAASVAELSERLADQVPETAFDTAVEAAGVQITVRPGVAVTVTGQEGDAGAVVVVAGAMRLLIHTPAADVVPAVSALAGEHDGGARVYSIADRRDARSVCPVCACHGNHALQGRA